MRQQRDNYITEKMSVFNKKVQANFDKLANFVTGLGLGGFKSDYNQHAGRQTLSFAELESLYTDSWIAEKIVTLPAEDAYRKGVVFEHEDKERVEAMNSAFEEFDVLRLVTEAEMWGRLYGGAILMPIFTTDTDWSMGDTLDVDKIKQGTLARFVVYDRTIVTPFGSYNTNPLRENFLEPDYYSVAGGGVYRIHYSRISKFIGQLLPYQLRIKNQYWGNSVLQKVVDDISNAETAANCGAGLISEAVTDVIKIPNLINDLASDAGTAALVKRWQSAKLIKGISKFLLLDTNETYEQKSHQALAGVTDILGKYLEITGAGADTPAIRMLNRSPAGLNSTGNNELEVYYEKVAKDRKRCGEPAIIKSAKIVYRHLYGESMPNDMKITFPSLYELDRTEQAEVEKKNGDTDKLYLTENIVPAHVIAQKLKASGQYNIPEEWIKALEESQAMPDEEETEPDSTEVTAIEEPKEPDSTEVTAIEEPKEPDAGEVEQPELEAEAE